MNTDAKREELAAPVTERDHVRGSSDASVVIVEYGDYECPHCGRAYWAIKGLLDELGDQVAFVFRNFPVAEVHPRAEAVAEALEAAGAQGRFWEMHDWFYEHQHQLEGLDLEDHAEALGLDMKRWKQDLRQRKYHERVREDLESGRESGVTGTPTFFMNGVRYEGAYDRGSLLAALRRLAPGAVET
jgi:protein-disulfide isomerase